mgnify:CR=1 FL=1
MLNCLTINNRQFQMVALSAIHSLMYDYQKAKVIFKNSNLIKYLIEINESFESENINYIRSGDNKQIIIRLKSTIKQIIKLLNE